MPVMPPNQIPLPGGIQGQGIQQQGLAEMMQRMNVGMQEQQPPILKPKIGGFRGQPTPPPGQPQGDALPQGSVPGFMGSSAPPNTPPQQQGAGQGFAGQSEQSKSPIISEIADAMKNIATGLPSAVSSLLGNIPGLKGSAAGDTQQSIIPASRTTGRPSMVGASGVTSDPILNKSGQNYINNANKANDQANDLTSGLASRRQQQQTPGIPPLPGANMQPTTPLGPMGGQRPPPGGLAGGPSTPQIGQAGIQSKMMPSSIPPIGIQSGQPPRGPSFVPPVNLGGTGGIQMKRPAIDMKLNPEIREPQIGDPAGGLQGMIQPQSPIAPPLMQKPQDVPAGRPMGQLPPQSQAPQTGAGMVPASPPASGLGSMTGDQSLGSLSSKYETSGKGPGMVSHGKGDLGGRSYGSYQFSSQTGRGKSGSLQGYIRNSKYGEQLRGMKVNSPEFVNKWKSIAKTDKAGFQADQHAYMKKTHYNPMRTRANKAGIPDTPAINQALWSTSVQHGPNWKGPQRAWKKGMSEGQFINALYNKRAGVFQRSKYYDSSPARRRVKKGVLNRYKNERRDALGIMGRKSKPKIRPKPKVKIPKIKPKIRTPKFKGGGFKFF